MAEHEEWHHESDPTFSIPREPILLHEFSSENPVGNSRNLSIHSIHSGGVNRPVKQIWKGNGGKTGPGSQ
jgi:hypothetical protein